jgi:gamma-glutamyltranspeptidase/glutathione hydrolase
MDIAAAVSAPRLHMQHLPDSLYYDAGGLSAALQDSLARRGHALAARPVGGIGVAPSIARRDDAWRGMADPRVPGLAAGY